MSDRDVEYCIYVLRSEKDGNLYTGQTNNLERRLKEHRSGKVKSTKNRRPFILVHVEKFRTREEARWRERELKTAWGKKKLKEILNNNAL